MDSLKVRATWQTVSTVNKGPAKLLNLSQLGKVTLADSTQQSQQANLGVDRVVEDGWRVSASMLSSVSLIQQQQADLETLVRCSFPLSKSPAKLHNAGCLMSHVYIRKFHYVATEYVTSFCCRPAEVAKGTDYRSSRYFQRQGKLDL